MSSSQFFLFLCSCIFCLAGTAIWKYYGGRDDDVNGKFGMLNQNFEVANGKFDLVNGKFGMANKNFYVVNGKFDIVNGKFDVVIATSLSTAENCPLSWSCSTVYLEKCAIVNSSINVYNTVEENCLSSLSWGQLAAIVGYWILSMAGTAVWVYNRGRTDSKKLAKPIQQQTSSQETRLNTKTVKDV